MEHSAERAAADAIRSASSYVTSFCQDALESKLVRGSFRAGEEATLRGTAGGGGRERARLLSDVEHRSLALYAEATDLLVGVADLLEMAHRRRAVFDARPTKILLRSALERAAVAHWLISDRKELGLADHEFNPRRGLADGLRKTLLLIPGQESCRRYLIWSFADLRNQRVRWREAQNVMGEAVDLGDIFGALDDLEAGLVATTTLCHWKAEPERIVDGSRQPAHLVRELGLRPERMPSLSDLVGPNEYAELSGLAHPSSRHDLNTDEQLETLLQKAVLVLLGSCSAMAWGGFPDRILSLFDVCDPLLELTRSL